MLPVVVFYLFNFLSLHSLAESRSFFHIKTEKTDAIELKDEDENINNQVEALIEIEEVDNTEAGEEQGLLQAYLNDPLNHVFLFILYF